MTDSLWPHLHASEDECNKFKLGLPQTTHGLGRLELEQLTVRRLRPATGLFIWKETTKWKRNRKHSPFYGILEWWVLGILTTTTKKKKTKTKTKERLQWLPLPTDHWIFFSCYSKAGLVYYNIYIIYTHTYTELHRETSEAFTPAPKPPANLNLWTLNARLLIRLFCHSKVTGTDATVRGHMRLSVPETFQLGPF